MKKIVDGIYDQLISLGLAEQLSEVEHLRTISTHVLSVDEYPTRLVQYLTPILLREFESYKGVDKSAQQLQLFERIVSMCTQSTDSTQRHHLTLPQRPNILRSVSSSLTREFVIPDIPLSMSDLLVNGSRDRSLGVQLRKEIDSADRIDLLCSFLKWTGFRLLRPKLEEFLESGKQLRILTTTYTGVTDYKVIEELEKMGAQIKVSYDSTKTRLHAKTWHLHRNTGFSTCYVGSSNLSAPALLDGVEWNVRLSVVDNPLIVQKISTTFEQYWHSIDFEPYSRERFVQNHSGGSDATYLPLIEIQPRSYQREMLNALSVEREMGYSKNLLIAATGTGKTMVAALDFRRLRSNNNAKTLLFVAHRREILKQALATYRIVLQQSTFGEVLWSGEEPNDWSVVFASVQSLKNTIHRLPKDHFDVIVIDESHHSAASAYTTLLNHFTPKYLLGLTATPERMDGQGILPYFDDRIAYEMRLWDALEQEILCPFQYFMTNVDTLDLRGVSWSNGGYSISELANVYTGNDLLVRQILVQLERIVLDPTRMRALGFCVNIAHAVYMAEKFNRVGIKSVAITSKSGERDRALTQLRYGEIQCIFCVDMFNEGVDVPNIDTVLFLRPTQSQTIFLQQLGRGLRRSDGKACLTVLDFVGQVHEKFQFSPLFKGLIGGSTASIRTEIEEDFPRLPSGCSIVLDRVAKETVLKSLQIGSGLRGLVKEMMAIGDCGLATFLKETELDFFDFYSRSSISLMEIRIRCGFIQRDPTSEANRFLKALYRMVYLNNFEMLNQFQQLLDDQLTTFSVDSCYHRWCGMALGLGDIPLNMWPDWIQKLSEMPDVLSEWKAYVHHLKSQSVTHPSFLIGEVPFFVHARYSRQDVMAVLQLQENSGKVKNIREGVYYVKESRTDLLFVTLNKTSEHFSTSTMYEDYPISPELFHWQSQSGTHDQTPVGQRYTQIVQGSNRKAVLFVRHSKKDEHGRTQAFTCLGPCTYVCHEGNQPMSITWQLENAIPFSVFQTMKVAAG